MKKLATLIALPLLTAAATAQEAVDLEEVEEIRRYTVEMIIFTYVQEVSTGSEIFVPDAPPPEEEPTLIEDLPDTEVLPEIDIQPDIDVEETDDDKFKLVLLEDEDYTLGDILEQMETLDIYQPLMHFGWTQPTWPEDDTEALELQSLAIPPAGLEGKLTLYLSRYLHLVVDLQLDEAAYENAKPPGPFDESLSYDETTGHGDTTGYYEPIGPDDAQIYPVHYRIAENRIIRNGELRYFDHPKFGVLAKITRFEEEPEPETEDLLLEETELLGYEGE